MTIAVKHGFTSPIDDSGDDTLIQPSHWNADHDITMASGKLLGRTSAGSGAVEEITLDTDATFSADSDSTVPTQKAVKTAIAAVPVGYATRALAAATTPVVAPAFIYIAGYTSAGDGGGALYKKVGGEPSHNGKFSITLSDGSTTAWYEIAELVLRPEMFGAVGDGSTLDTTPLQSCFDVRADAVIDLGGKSFKYSTLALSNNVLIKNGSLLSSTSTGTQIAVDPSARFKARGVTFTGGGSHATFAEHKILSQVGTSSARGVGMDLQDCSFSGCGNSPVYSEYCDNHNFVHNRFTDFAYAGFQVLSCNDGNALWNFSDASNAVGSSNNAYGFTITHHNSGYNTQPNPGTPLSTQAFGNNWRVIGNTVWAAKIWEGIDFHGGYNNVIAFNRVFGAAFVGILCGTSSNDAANYAGYNNIITGNLVTTYNEDGTASGVDGVYGIVINGGSVANGRHIVCTNNTVIGYGGRADVHSTLNATVPAIRVDNNLDMAIITGNIVDEWSGCAIEMTGSDGPVVANDNIFGPMRDTQAASAVIRVTGASSGRHSIIGNVLKDGGNQPAYGVLFTSSYVGQLTYGSDFRTAGTEIQGAPGSGGSIRKISYS